MMKFFSKGFDIERGQYGMRMVLTGAWTDAARRTLEKRNIVELELNPAKGWQRNNLAFLSLLGGLVAFAIVDEKTVDVSPIHALSHLRSLKVLTYCDTPIDFTRFPQLEEVSLEWREGASSLYDCATLRHVFINNCSAKSLDVFHKLNRLEYLSLKSPRLEMIGNVPTLQSLSFLGVYNAGRLYSLAGVEQFPNLEMLEIERCRKISNIVPVASLRRLQRLMFANCGDIDSLKPVAELKELREVFFHESTRIVDGDLTPLKSLPHLEDVSFQERRHYNCGWEDLPMRCSAAELKKARQMLGE